MRVRRGYEIERENLVGEEVYNFERVREWGQSYQVNVRGILPTQGWRRP
jgi:hypothetical protein